MNDPDKQRRKALKRAYLEQDPQYRALKHGPTTITSVAISSTADDSELEWGIVQVALRHIPEGSHARAKERSAIREMPPGPRALLTTWLLESELLNGGFPQFFFNQQPYVWREAAAGYHALGLPAPAQATTSAARKYRRGVGNFEPEESSILDQLEVIRAHKAALIRKSPKDFAVEQVRPNPSLQRTRYARR